MKIIVRKDGKYSTPIVAFLRPFFTEIFENYTLACDIESEGLYKNCSIITVRAIEDKERAVVFQTNTDEEVEDVKQLLQSYHTVWHNASYDFGTLNWYSDSWDDTLWLAKLAYPQLQVYDLKFLSEKLTRQNNYSHLDKSAIRKTFKRQLLLTNDQIDYCFADVDVVSDIYTLPQIQQWLEQPIYRLDKKNLEYAIQYQQNGLYINREKIAKAIKELQLELEECQEIVDNINVKSYQQVRKLLGVNQSDKNFLMQLAGDKSNPDRAAKAKAIIDARSIRTRITMYEKYLRHEHQYTKFSPVGAATGRFSASGGDLDNHINFLQIPRNMQSYFQEPKVIDSQEYVCVHADYSTAQLRIGCSLMNEAEMAKAFFNNEDLHIKAVTDIIGIPYTDKSQRQAGKAVNFGLIFGQGWASFIDFAYTNYGILFSEQEAKDITARYASKYPNINKYHRWVWNNYKKVPMKTPMGRRVFAKVGNSAINHATQGAEAEMIKLAIHRLVTDHPDYLNKIVNIVHDSIWTWVKVEEAEQTAETLIKYMKQAWDEVTKMKDFNIKGIPMPVEAEWVQTLKICKACNTTHPKETQVIWIDDKNEFYSYCNNCKSNQPFETTKYYSITK